MSWSANGLPVHTRLTATRDSIVYGGVEGEKLYVVALDPATGIERWRRSSDVSARVPGVEQSILTDGDTAYFLAEPRSGRTAVVAVTTATGQERWRRELETRAVDPDAIPCGDAVCIVAFTSSGSPTTFALTPRKELWQVSKSDGRYVAKYPITADGGNGNDAMLGIHPLDAADATLLMASFGVGYVTQFSDLGKTKEWSKPVAELFGQSPVGPDRGWASWRVVDGWIAWLGPKFDMRLRLQAGDVLAPGVVAGFDDEGNSRWIAPNRGFCTMFDYSRTDAVFCDGEWRMISPERGERRPSIVEGRDGTTGAVTWKLDLEREIEVSKAAEKVLRIDDDRYLIDLSSGPIELDVRHGPQPAPNDRIAGWCKPEIQGEKIERWGLPDSFLQARNPFPCHLGGDRADATLPVPEFAGVNVSGWGVWVEDGQVRAKHQ